MRERLCALTRPGDEQHRDEARDSDVESPEDELIGPRPCAGPVGSWWPGGMETDLAGALAAAGCSPDDIDRPREAGRESREHGSISQRKTGTPISQAAGTAFSVTVNAVDANWNPVTNVTDTVAITSSDLNASLPVTARTNAHERLEKGAEVLSKEQAHDPVGAVHQARKEVKKTRVGHLRFTLHA